MIICFYFVIQKLKAQEIDEIPVGGAIDMSL